MKLLLSEYAISALELAFRKNADDTTRIYVRQGQPVIELHPHHAYPRGDNWPVLAASAEKAVITYPEGVCV